MRQEHIGKARQSPPEPNEQPQLHQSWMPDEALEREAQEILAEAVDNHARQRGPDQRGRHVDPEQVQFLDETLQEAAAGSTEVQRLHAAWRAGDVDTLWNGMAVEMRDRYPALYKRINVARNDAWVVKLDQRLRDAHDANSLVVVGSLHLLGPDGVVEKLRAKGYRVERICSACAQ